MKKSKEDIKKRFLESVQYHNMKILNDDEVFRCIAFKQEDTNDYAFKLITFPGGLTITGDMGCYTFERVRDMFQFFSSPLNNLHIREDYWSEKCVSKTKRELQEWSSDVFKKEIQELFNSFSDDTGLTPDQKKDYWKEIQEQVLDSFYLESKDLTYENMNLFTPPESVDSNIFEDFYEYTFGEGYSQSYLWCLYAIVWGIIKYQQERKS